MFKKLVLLGIQEENKEGRMQDRKQEREDKEGGTDGRRE
jgi:hypothetical protein